MRGSVRVARIGFAVACLLALQGCAAIALSLAGLAGGTGLDHTLDGIVYRTYPAPAAGTRLATLQSLSRMGMTVVKSEPTDGEWLIAASIANRTVEVSLESLSDSATRARVVVSYAEFALIKDRSTGDAILDQIAKDLSTIPAEKHRVATIQALLVTLGYDPGEVDGVMGRKTRTAIQRFQRSAGVPANGDDSARLIGLLRKQVAAVEAAALAARKPEKEPESPAESPQ